MRIENAGFIDLRGGGGLVGPGINDDHVPHEGQAVGRHDFLHAVRIAHRIDHTELDFAIGEAGVFFGEGADAVVEW